MAPEPTPTDADREAWIRLEPLIGNMLRILELRKAFTRELIAAEARGRAAEFIRTACNAHRALVSALRGLLAMTQTDPDDCDSPQHYEHAMECAQQNAIAALKDHA